MAENWDEGIPEVIMTDAERDHEEAFEEVKISVEELDKQVEKYYTARADYDLKKITSNSAEKIKDEEEQKLIAMLQACKKTSYKVDGIGNVTVYDKYSVSAPSDPDDKQLLWAFILEKLGQAGLDKYQSVNSQALTSLFNTMMEEEGLKEMPGVGMPKARTVLSFTKSKPKAKGGK